MIQVQILGNLGRDAEVKTINDKQYLSFSVASTEKRNNEESVTWVSVLYPHQEALLPYLKKGQQVFVSGRLKAGIYQNNNSFGIDLSVFAQTLQLCGGKKEESTTSNQAPYGATVAHTAASNPVPTHETVAQPAVSPFPPPFPPAVDDNGNAKSDDLPFDYRGAAV